MSNMDYFEGIKNEEFVAFFLEDLNCRKELTQYIYPHEHLESDDVIDEHITRCKNILKLHMREIVIENAYDDKKDFSYDQYEDIIDNRMDEISPLLEPLIMKYLEDIKINYINYSDNKEEE